MKTTLSTILMASAFAVGLVHGPTVYGATPQPNIVHILTDDLGWMDPVCYYRAVRGRESIYETPNMDRLAANGMRFMQAYSPAPTCAPSRAAYMAGQYTPHTGVLHVMGGRLARPFPSRSCIMMGHGKAQVEDFRVPDSIGCSGQWGVGRSDGRA